MSSRIDFVNSYEGSETPRLVARLLKLDDIAANRLLRPFETFQRGALLDILNDRAIGGDLAAEDAIANIPRLGGAIGV